MMSERTSLITARRESEDNLIKTIIQLGSALIVLISGFVSQTTVSIGDAELALFIITLVGLVISIVAGLTEQYFSSKAYEEQQRLVEDFYQKAIATFGPAPSNKWVRISQLVAFATFVFALICLGSFALLRAGDTNDQRESAVTAAK
jgi:hypothetical protein